jgi:uncharacterized membrane protein YeaQ/YmgE (transglycosylase-associated protein family)
LHCTVVLTTHRQPWRCNTIIVVGMSLRNGEPRCLSLRRGFLLSGGGFPTVVRSPERTFICPGPTGIGRAANQPGGRTTCSAFSGPFFIGFIAGVIAKFVTPGSTYEPKGFILTTALGIVGALVATYLGQALGWYQAGHGAGFIASIVGAALILLVWGFIGRRT